MVSVAIWVEFAHFVSYHLAYYPNPNPNPNSNPNHYPNPFPNPNPGPNPNPKLGVLFHKMCKLCLFSISVRSINSMIFKMPSPAIEHSIC